MIVTVFILCNSPDSYNAEFKISSPLPGRSALENRNQISQARHDHGRAIPSFFMRKYSVDRFIPRRVAAPLGPERIHLVSFKVARMCSRSTSAKVRSFSLPDPGVMRD